MELEEGNIRIEYKIIATSIQEAAEIEALIAKHQEKEAKKYKIKKKKQTKKYTTKGKHYIKDRKCQCGKVYKHIGRCKGTKLSKEAISITKNIKKMQGTCEDCNKEYQKTSNRQKRYKECAQKRIEQDNNYMKHVNGE